jgi:hypothetical protein
MIRMVERRSCPSFALEPIQGHRVGGHGARKELDRDITFQPFVMRLVHLAHAASAEQLEHL